MEAKQKKSFLYMVVVSGGLSILPPPPHLFLKTSLCVVSVIP